MNLIGATPARQLAMQTRKGSQIVNVLDFTIPQAGAQLEMDSYRKRYVGAKYRGLAPCGTFNCHGMTFAARRAAIHSSSEVQRILQEDGYQLINWTEVLPGDVAVWRADQSEGGEYIHSGIVIRGPDRIEGVPNQPIILSKWGSGDEVLHAARECPYDGTITYHRIVR